MTRAEYRAALKGRRCYVGMDLSSTKDLTAIVAVFPDGDGGYDVLAQFFVPQDNIRERSHTDRVPYDEWARHGFLIPTPGNQVDYDYVRQQVNDWGAEFQIHEIPFDDWNAKDLMQRLREQDGFTTVPMGQGYKSLSGPSKSLERLVLSRAIRHDGHPVLRWCIGNVVTERDAAGNIKPSKAKSTEKIDGVVALVMAIDRAEVNAAAQEPDYSILMLGGAH